jgi:hypothetical protein
LRHCATSRKVAGSIPIGVIRMFNWQNTSGRTMALGLTQPLTQMSTRNISWGVKMAGVSGWKPYQLRVLKSGSLNLLKPSGPVQVCNETALTFEAITTNRKVAGLIPDSVVGIFHWHNPSGRTMALG